MNSKTAEPEAVKGTIGRKPVDICARAVAYALRAIKLYEYLQSQKNGAGWILGKQFLRSACSIGANIEEAQAGESRSDFIHKLGVAQKEARESRYWLNLLSDSGIVRRNKLKPLIQETKEILAIITAIIVSTKEQQSGRAPQPEPKGGPHPTHNISQALNS